MSEKREPEANRPAGWAAHHLPGNHRTQTRGISTSHPIVLTHHAVILRTLVRTFALVVRVAGAARAPRSAATSRHAAILPRTGGALVMALGDTLALVAHRYRCCVDVCVLRPDVQKLAWTSQSSALDVLRGGFAVPRRAGIHRLRCRVGGQIVRDSIRVLPPVRRLAWIAHPETLYVGDTLRIAVLARHSAGRTIGPLGVTAHIPGTGEMQWFDRDGYAASFVDQPGMVTLVGRLAHRVDTLRIRTVGVKRPKLRILCAHGCSRCRGVGRQRHGQCRMSRA